MQRIARLFVVLLVVASMLTVVPARAQGSITVSVDVFLSGDDLVERGSTGCMPTSVIGSEVVFTGSDVVLLGEGEFLGVSESPTTRAGCLFNLTIRVAEADQYLISVGAAYVGTVTAAELAHLDNHLEIAIRSSDFIVESRDWRFSDREAVISSGPTPTATATTSSQRTTTQRRSTPTPTTSSRSRGTTTTDRWGCADLEDYQAELFSLLLSVDEYDAVETLLDADDFTTLRPSVLRRASDGLDEWAGLMEEMDDVPLAAQEYHEAFIDLVSMMSTVTISLANGGAFAIVPYSDAMETVTDDLDAAERLGERRCGDDWTDVFGS